MNNPKIVESYYKRKPWLKTLYKVRYRCKDKNSKYCKHEIKCLLTQDDIKYLWERDKPWLLKRLSIDRIDSQGNYTRENCRFIELSENSRLGGKRSGITRKALSAQGINYKNNILKTESEMSKPACATCKYHEYKKDTHYVCKAKTKIPQRIYFRVRLNDSCNKYIRRTLISERKGK